MQEYIAFLNPADMYGWFDQLNKNFEVGLPFHGLTLPDKLYNQTQKEIRNFYFGPGKIENSTKCFNEYVQMVSDSNFVYSSYQAMQAHSLQAKTACYR